MQSDLRRCVFSKRTDPRRFLHFKLIASLSGCLVLAVLASPGVAQTQPPTQPGNVTVTPTPNPGELTVERVTALRKQVEDNADLDPELKTRLLETYTQALAELTAAAEARKSALDSKARIDSLTQRLADAERDFAAQADPRFDDVSSESTLNDLSTALSTRQVAVQEAKAAVTQIESEPTVRSERRKQLEALLASHNERRTALETQLNATPPADENPLVTAARQTLLRARLNAIDAQNPAYQAELARYTAERDAGLQAALAKAEKRRVTRLGLEIDELNRRINDKRQAEAAEALRQAEQAAEAEMLKTNPGLRAIAERTRQLADENKTLTEDIAKASRQATAAQKRLSDTQELVTRTKQEVTRIGLTGAIGLKLRKQMLALPDASSILRDCRVRQELMREIEFKRISYKEELDAMDVPDSVELADDEESLDFPTQLRRSQYATIESLVTNYDKYFATLETLDRDEQESAELISGYRDYIAELVLWIRSNRGLELSDLRFALQTVVWFFRADHFLEVGSTLLADLVDDPIPEIMFLLAFLLLLAGQRRCRNELSGIGERAARKTFSEFVPTLRAMLLTLIISAPMGVVLLFFGWRLFNSPSSPEFSKSFGNGMFGLGASLLGFNLLRQSCRARGLGAAHFGWSTEAMLKLRRNIYLLMVFVLPLTFMINTLRVHENPQGRDSLERILFIAMRVIRAWFLFRILSPRTGVFQEFFMENPDSLFTRLQRFWFPLITITPLVCALLAAIGFYYTAYELTARLNITIWMIVGIFYVRSLLVRWFTVSQRRIRIEQARQRRAAMLEESPDSGNEFINIPREAELTDLQAIGEQTMRLINSGMAVALFGMVWLAWVDVLPALKVFDSWQLWSTSVEATIEVERPDGTSVFQTEPRVEPITVGDLLLAVLILALTWSAGRNIPGLLEIALLNRLPLEPAGRYAIRTVTRYVISAIGLVTAFHAVGIGWSKVQWLVAALTVGLGFGMQEIFANFISGLIILFERPVRIGDIVTIDNVTGVVSRVQIRATTITDWDRKEYIVPNREFITGRVLNWTLSDKTNRIVINVGVAYGSDTALARSLLLQVAKDHPRILDDPEPVATFESFGESTLDLVLRAYLPGLETRLQTITEMLEEIDRLFAEAGLEIAFPQRDLHLRSLPPGFPTGGSIDHHSPSS